MFFAARSTRSEPDAVTTPLGAGLIDSEEAAPPAAAFAWSPIDPIGDSLLLRHLVRLKEK
jgi:hypothetical protein